LIIITASVELRPEHWERAKQLAQSHCEASRAEPGCVAHDWYPHPKRPHTLFFFEQWEDQAAIDLHFGQAYSARLVEAFREWAASEVVLRILPVADVIERRIV